MPYFKHLTYFVIAAGTVLQTSGQPTSSWGWIQLAAGCIVAGFVAVRALESKPTAPDGSVLPLPPTVPTTAVVETKTTTVQTNENPK